MNKNKKQKSRLWCRRSLKIKLNNKKHAERERERERKSARNGATACKTPCGITSGSGAWLPCHHLSCVSTAPLRRSRITCVIQFVQLGSPALWRLLFALKCETACVFRRLPRGRMRRPDERTGRPIIRWISSSPGVGNCISSHCLRYVRAV